MMKTILRRIALLASVILLVISLNSMIPRPGYATPFLGMLVLAIYAVATGLALVAIERPSLGQRLRVPGVVCNVLAVGFPIFAWAKWVTGTLALSVIAGLIPCIGFTLLVVALLWVLEAEKVFQPTRNWIIAVGVLTFGSFVLFAAGGSRRYAGRDYAGELEFLSVLASIAGLIYAVTAVVWAIFLYKGLTRKRYQFADNLEQGGSEGDLQLGQYSEQQNERGVEQTEAAQVLDSEMKKYDIIAMDGKYEYMGLLYSTPQDAIAAARLNRGDT